MRIPSALVLASFLIVGTLTTSVALTVNQPINAEYMREHPNDFKVTVKGGTNGLIYFKIIRVLSASKLPLRSSSFGPSSRQGNHREPHPMLHEKQREHFLLLAGS